MFHADRTPKFALDGAGRGGRALAREGARGVAARGAADALVRVRVPAAALDRPDRVLRADPGRGRRARLARGDSVRVLPRAGSTGWRSRSWSRRRSAMLAVAARERLRVRRGAVAPRVAARVPAVRAGSARARAVRVDPSAVLQRAAGDGDRSPSIRWRGSTTANFEVLVVDNNTRDERLWRPVEAHCARLGAAFPLLPSAGVAGLQGGRAQFRAARDRSPRRGDRRRRRRLRGRSRLARAARRPFRRRRRSRWCRRRRRTASSRTPRSGG